MNKMKEIEKKKKTYKKERIIFFNILNMVFDMKNDLYSDVFHIKKSSMVQYLSSSLLLSSSSSPSSLSSFLQENCTTRNTGNCSR